MNYFKLFDIPLRYIIDVKTLEKNYLKLQLLYHPDRAKNETERRKNLEQSMLINEGLKLLKNDYLRALHILELNGLIVDETSLKEALNPEQLDNMLGQFELIEDSEDINFLNNFKETKLAQQEELVKRIDIAIEKNSINEIYYLVATLRYNDNLIANTLIKLKNFAI